jgi:hypothetical protein
MNQAVACINVDPSEKSKKVTVDKKIVNEIIDKLDDALETTIKFDYTRALKCYCDIMAQIITTCACYFKT